MLCYDNRIIILRFWILSLSAADYWSCIHRQNGLARCPPSSSTLSPTRQSARDLSLDGSSEEKVDRLVATAHVNSNGEWRVFGNCFLRYGLGTLRRVADGRPSGILYTADQRKENTSHDRSSTTVSSYGFRSMTSFRPYASVHLRPPNPVSQS